MSQKGKASLCGSMGLAPEHHDALLFRADQALYDAKHNGRNRCVIAGEFADKKRSGAA